MVPGRNHAQCQQRWSRVLQPGIKKGQWTAAEDSHLHSLVARGWMNWTVVAGKISGRTSKQCRERWYSHLDPSVNRGPYSEEEDVLILAQHDELGGRWAQISRMLKGRTSEAVRNRFKTLDRWRKSGSIDRCPQFSGQRSFQFHSAPTQGPEASHEPCSSNSGRSGLPALQILPPSPLSSLPHELQPLSPPPSFHLLDFAARPSVVAEPAPVQAAAPPASPPAAPTTPSVSSLCLHTSSGKGTSDARVHTLLLPTPTDWFGGSCSSFSSLLSTSISKVEARASSSQQPRDWADEVDQVLQDLALLDKDLFLDEDLVFDVGVGQSVLLQHVGEDLDLGFCQSLVELAGDH
jgi:myb proto-oncogene protein